MATVCVLMLAAGAPWESRALTALGQRTGIVVLKRCVDVSDLLAAATAGQADVAVLALDTHDFDAGAVEHLRRHRVRPVVVAADPDQEHARARAHRIGLTGLVADDDLGALTDAVLDADAPATRPPGSPPTLDPAAALVELGSPGSAERPVERPVQAPARSSIEAPAIAGSDGVPEPARHPGGRIIAVWGPAGAPGRTTVALALGAELARRGAPTVVVDADPYGGSVAQHLGVLDEVSGLLATARLSSSGELSARFPTVQRAVADRLHVVTGLPRASRWVEMREGALEHLLELGQQAGHVVVDTGFCLEDDPGHQFGSRPGRNQMTLASISMADEIVVVGAADPVGLSRLAHALVELRELLNGRPVRVVVNQMRSSLGWSESDIAGMVEGFSRTLSLHFLPEDRGTVDRAMIAGRGLLEMGDSPLTRAVEGLAGAVVPEARAPMPVRPRLRRRTAGTARSR